VNSGHKTLPDALKEVRVGGALLDLAERAPDQLYGVVEDDLEKSFFGPKVLKDGTLGYSQPLYHPVDTGLLETVAGKLLHRSVQNSLLLVGFKVLESLARSHMPASLTVK